MTCSVHRDRIPDFLVEERVFIADEDPRHNGRPFEHHDGCLFGCTRDFKGQRRFEALTCDQSFCQVLLWSSVLLKFVLCGGRRSNRDARI